MSIGTPHARDNKIAAPEGRVFLEMIWTLFSRLAALFVSRCVVALHALAAAVMFR